MSERLSEYVDDERLEQLGKRRSGASLEVQWMARELQQARTELAKIEALYPDAAHLPSHVNLARVEIEVSRIELADLRAELVELKAAVVPYLRQY